MLCTNVPMPTWRCWDALTSRAGRPVFHSTPIAHVSVCEASPQPTARCPLAHCLSTVRCPHAVPVPRLCSLTLRSTLDARRSTLDPVPALSPSLFAARHSTTLDTRHSPDTPPTLDAHRPSPTAPARALPPSHPACSHPSRHSPNQTVALVPCLCVPRLLAPRSPLCPSPLARRPHGDEDLEWAWKLVSRSTLACTAPTRRSPRPPHPTTRA
jgi:hypothetical protein